MSVMHAVSCYSTVHFSHSHITIEMCGGRPPGGGGGGGGGITTRLLDKLFQVFGEKLRKLICKAVYSCNKYRYITAVGSSVVTSIKYFSL